MYIIASRKFLALSICQRLFKLLLFTYFLSTHLLSLSPFTLQDFWWRRYHNLSWRYSSRRRCSRCFLLINNRSIFEYDGLKSDSLWVFRSYRSIQIPSFSQNARANATQARDRANRSWKSFPAIFDGLIHMYILRFVSLSKFWLNCQRRSKTPRRRRVSGHVHHESVNPIVGWLLRQQFEEEQG